MEKVRDLKIYGSGSSSGGEYNKIRIMGEGRINGDINCNDLKINGEGTLDGNLKATNTVRILGEGRLVGNVDCTDFKVNGEGEVDGNLKAEGTVTIRGETDIGGNLNAQKVKVQGELEVNGELFADEAKITGNLNATGDCNAEIFTVEGGLTIDGLLNADVLKINLYWPCKVHEIGGSEITVKKSGKLSFLGLKNMVTLGGQNELTVDIIEGDNVYLENTKAKVVRGNNVTIGYGCKIELVEYKENFRQDEKSEINTNKKI
ncbi:bactofilin family protein [Methanobacterium sp.]|uniref:bactofilin family protein n=1 Tax=Methanobacterium sp. TaxID=2164 RepID=UPI003C726EE7